MSDEDKLLVSKDDLSKNAFSFIVEKFDYSVQSILVFLSAFFSSERVVTTRLEAERVVVKNEVKEAILLHEISAQLEQKNEQKIQQFTKAKQEEEQEVTPQASRGWEMGM